MVGWARTKCVHFCVITTFLEERQEKLERGAAFLLSNGLQRQPFLPVLHDYLPYLAHVVYAFSSSRLHLILENCTGISYITGAFRGFRRASLIFTNLRKRTDTPPELCCYFTAGKMSGEAAKYHAPPGPPPDSYQMQPMQNNGGYNYSEPYQGQYGNSYGDPYGNAQYQPPPPQPPYGNSQYQEQPPPHQPPKPAPGPNGNYGPDYGGPPPSYDEVFKVQKPKYNDLWAGILFLLTCLGFAAVSGISIQGYGTLLPLIHSATKITLS